MKDADILLGAVENGRVTVLDENRAQANTARTITIHCLEELTISWSRGGKEMGSKYSDRAKRKMKTKDKLDKALVPGQRVSIIWAMADTAASGVKHNIAEGEGFMVLEGGAASGL